MYKDEKKAKGDCGVVKEHYEEKYKMPAAGGQGYGKDAGMSELQQADKLAKDMKKQRNY